ncbi:FimD/PapC C-terminal domain-containing protein [Pseudomonas sp. S11A4]|uniref:FimD/PapC C-terminal domain-containing protein n=1 Tax=Pseudomonas sp. S11A4 TaxID=1476791 RepID=UPI00406C51BE
MNFATGQGYNAFVVLSRRDGKPVPFGASVQDKNTNKEVGIVGEAGVTYLLGIKAGAELVARWDDAGQCSLAKLPEQDVLTNVATPAQCL